MSLTNAEFEALIADTTKRIEGDIMWTGDEDHSPSVEFRAEILSDTGYPLFVRGSFNPLVPAVTFALIHKGVGRIYGLDMGKDHRNPDNNRTGDKHKHRWTERFRDKEAYVPPDITALASSPVEAWSQFCAEAAITHRGTMHPPPPHQGDFIE